MPKLWWLSVVYAAIFICGTVLSKHAVQASNYGEMDWKRAQEEDLIKDGLPGQPEVQFKQYSGYITVNASAGRALFYWFIEADSHSAHKKPLILWLNGGPGCSSIAYGAIEEIGPFTVLPNASGLSLKTHAWNKVANLLFLESPAGVGFSYTNTSSDLKTSGDKRTAREAHTFLVKWFERFPQYKGRVFYIMGESYAGHYVPQLAKLVYENHVKGVENPDMNLKGLLVGNGVLDNYYDNVGLIEYWWDHALISDTSYHDILAACDFHKANLSATCTHLINNVFEHELGDIDPYSIYTPVCLTQSRSRRLAARRSINSPSIRHFAGYDPCIGNYAEVYFNRPDVQNALHANLTGIPYNWTGCSDVLFENWKDAEFSMIPVYKELISAGFKIWLFSGDVDAVVPITGTRYGVQHMNLTEQEKWFSWYLDGQVAGRCQVYKGLSLVTVRNAGHEVPYTQPERAYVLITSYLASDDTPLLPRNKTS
ncbi:hypothetical protein L7F22_061018 [Adiantum nelumboides]|nr:hypothetical protein [Adiantum nelumboides]